MHLKLTSKKQIYPNYSKIDPSGSPLYFNYYQDNTGGCWHSSTGISPYLILMRIPYNAVKAFNTGVSLYCNKGLGLQVANLFSDIIIFARLKRSWRIYHIARFVTNVPVCHYSLFKEPGFAPI